MRIKKIEVTDAQIDEAVKAYDDGEDSILNTFGTERPFGEHSLYALDTAMNVIDDYLLPAGINVAFNPASDLDGGVDGWLIEYRVTKNGHGIRMLTNWCDDDASDFESVHEFVHFAFALINRSIAEYNAFAEMEDEQ